MASARPPVTGIREFPCPACGFLTFEEPAGSYEVCPVCTWENDTVGLRYPLTAVGPNAKSLADLQKWVLKRFPRELQRAGRYQREAAWRPLSPLEIELHRVRDRTPRDYADEAALDSPAYYWRQKR